MGLFSDKCTAIVSLETGRHLTGDELAAAKKALRDERRLFHGESAVLRDHGWGICGHSVKKKARFCSKCGAPAPKGWVKCPSCGKWVGNEMTHCWNCDHPLRPETRTNLEGGVWNRTPEMFAERFEVGEVENMLKNGLQVQEGTAAILLDAGKESRVLGPGRYDPASTLRAINWFGNPPPRSAVLVDAGEFVVPLRMEEGLRTADGFPVSVYAELTLRFVRSRADDFLANFMKEARALPYESLGKSISAQLAYGVDNLCNTSTVEDLVKDPDRRDQFEAAIRKAASETLKAWGFEVVRVGATDFASPEYEKVRLQNATLDEKRRELEFLQKTRALLNEDAAKNRELDAAERESADGGKMDAAKGERDLAEYMDQLAQEKEISAAERDVELKLLLMAQENEITSKEADYLLARKVADRAAEMEAELKDTDHDIAIREKLRAYTVDAMLKDELGQEELLKIQAREKEILAGVERSQIDLGAYRVRTEGFAQTDVDADRTRRIGEAEAAAADAKNKVEDEQLKRLVELDNLRRESKAKVRSQEISDLKGLSVEALIATADDPEKIRALVEFARIHAQKGMSADQLLGQAAATSDAAANALAAKSVSEKEALNRLVDEIKKLAGENSAKDERLLAQLAQVMGRAAERPDAPPPPPPPTQQIIK